MVVISIKALETFCGINNYLAINILINNRELVIFVYSITKLFVLFSVIKLSYLALWSYVWYIAMQNYIFSLVYTKINIYK